MKWFSPEVLELVVNGLQDLHESKNGKKDPPWFPILFHSIDLIFKVNNMLWALIDWNGWYYKK